MSAQINYSLLLLKSKLLKSNKPYKFSKFSSRNLAKLAAFSSNSEIGIGSWTCVNGIFL